MNERLTEVSAISFACRCCGTCCSSDLEIFVNTQDIWNLRNHFRRPTSFLIENYLAVERRPEFGSYPVCVLRTRKGYCPFLSYHLCSVHPSRPAGCRLFPVVHSYAVSGESVFARADFLDSCPGGKEAKRRGLNEWLASNDFHSYDDMMALQRRLGTLGRVRLDEPDMKTLETITFDFDTLDDFPFRNDYPIGVEPARATIRWLSDRVEDFLVERKSK
jgi:uncharacterized protein